MIRRTLVALLLAFLGCANPRPEPQVGLLERSPAYDHVLDAGLAVAPLAHVDPVVDAAEISAFLTNELYHNLLVILRGVTLERPDDVLGIMAAGGEESVEWFRQMRRELVRGEIPVKDDLARLSRVVQHRFLLVCWVGEKRVDGLEDIGASYTQVDHAIDVSRASFEQIEGRLDGVILDLWEGDVVWRGAETYRTQKMYEKSPEAEDELERVRSDAVTRFAYLFDPLY